MNNTNLGYVTNVINEFENYIETNLDLKNIDYVDIEGKNYFIAFVSLGNTSIRAKVFRVISDDHKKLINQLKQRLTRLVKQNHINPQWIKLDIVKEVQKVNFQKLELEVSKTRKNYYRYGISFDERFELSFLEQEINGNAMIKEGSTKRLSFDETNINNYLKAKGNLNLPFIKKMYENKDIYKFKTISIFKDRNFEESFHLHNTNLMNGIRKTIDIKTETKMIIEKSTKYLAKQVQPSGKFIYGYFSNFGKEINTYNILRHASSLYALCEGYEIVKEDDVLKSVEKGIEYLLNEAVVYKDKETAFVVDFTNEKEIKLGSNATAILAMTKYMEVTKTDKYLNVVQDLARGILNMKLPNEGFIHVLNYPDYSIKSLNRIIYYEGEAIFALLRLYAQDKDQKWLTEVQKTFDYFIDNDYWKHNDHWLSYAANEITLYDQADKYFIFGLKNCDSRLNFIYHRETTYPTFLELTMATFKMIKQIKEYKKDYLLTYINENYLLETIDQRAEYQRVGFFYPELAMYTKEPKKILNGFFIRHHSFRVRIDDVEHYLSGYCQYYHYRLPYLI